MERIKHLLWFLFILAATVYCGSAYTLNDGDDVVDFLRNEDEIDNYATDDDLDNYEESQDPQPIRFRRLRLRRIRVRFRLRRLKCPSRCASYYACLANTSGLGKLACLALKKHCYC